MTATARQAIPTARDQAADAIYQLLGCICKQNGECPSCRTDAEGYVDAIPTDVLQDLHDERLMT